MAITKATASSIAPAAKGDLVVGSATNDAGVLTVGANDTVLTADSSTATGLKWAAVSAGGMTSIATGTLSGASVSITSIPSTYIDLVLYIDNPYIASGTAHLRMTINADTSSVYGRWFFQSNGSNGGSGSSIAYWAIGDDTNAPLRTSSTNYASASINFPNYASATGQKSMSFMIQERANTFSALAGTGGTTVSNTAAISSIQINTSASTFSGGTYTLYGVK